jgi:hypothetical protein
MMPSLVGTPEPGLRIVSRRPSSRSARVCVKPLRPSLLDLRLQGDPWISLYTTDAAGIYFNGCLLATFAALPFDVPALNTQLQVLRHRLPRRR